MKLHVVNDDKSGKYSDSERMSIYEQRIDAVVELCFSIVGENKFHRTSTILTVNILDIHYVFTTF